MINEGVALLENVAAVDWRGLVFRTEWLAKLDRLAARRFGEGGLADEAAFYVLEQLSADDWSLLNAFKGQAKPETFLNTVTGNLLEEFSRRRFGRARPPEWLRRAGDVWVALWRLICLERRDIESVVQGYSVGDLRDPQEIRRVIKTIRTRLPWCGVSNREIAVNTDGMDEEDDIAPEEGIPDLRSPDRVLSARNYRELLWMVGSLLSDEPSQEDLPVDLCDDGIGVAGYAERLSRFRHGLRLSDEERILLRMVYQDGYKRTAVAEALGMAPHGPGRIIDHALVNIRAALSDAGMDIDDLRAMLN